MERGVVKKVQKQSAVQQALENLKAYVYVLAAQGEYRLPSEEELAQQLGLSRLTLREALAVLERDGLISRMQGKGTVINPFAQCLKSRIDTSREIDGFLEEAGYKTSGKLLGYRWQQATAEEAEKLGIDEGEEMLVVEKVFMADQIPAAFYIDRIPRRKFRHEDFGPADMESSMFALVENACGCRITHDVLEIIPTVADEKLAAVFKIPVNTPLLRLDVVVYQGDGSPVMYDTEYYYDKFIRFTLCRNVAYTS